MFESFFAFFGSVLVCDVAAILAVLPGAVICGIALVAKKVGTHLADPVWVGSAEVGKDSMMGLRLAIKMIPDTDSDLVAGAIVR